MLTPLYPHNHKHRRERAQAIVEFAIALPILLALLVGILEVGRLIFIYASVTNASRDASRYASAVGMADGTSYYKYQYCAGIRDVAKRSAFLLKLSDADITISYDHGTTGSTFDTCDGSVDTNISINEGANYDRATITIDTTYHPMVNLIPIPQRDIQSTSSRTILGIYELDAATGGGGWAPGSGPTRTKTPTPTLTPTVTSTPTDTPTPKHTPKFATFTPSATDTPGPATSIPTDTATATITPTSTITPTATTTPTSTVTSTPFLCSGVSADALTIKNKAMTTTVTNPTNEALTISSVVVTWNWDSGASGGQALALAQGQYGATSLSSANLPNSTGTHFFTFSPSITIPAGGTSSIFTFTFNKNYDFPTGRTSVSFNVSAPSCGSFPVTTSK